MTKVHRQEFVIFYSPGTIFSEETTRPCESRSTASAVAMAASIVERHTAKPYGFQFESKLVADPVPDGEGGELAVMPRTVAKSGMHFLGGSVFSRASMPITEDLRILRSNMECNNWPWVILTATPWVAWHPFEDDDVVLDVRGRVIRTGRDADLAAYRVAFAEWYRKRWSEPTSDVLPPGVGEA